MIKLHRQDGVVETYDSLEELHDEIERRWEEDVRREELRGTPEGRRTIMAERYEQTEGRREKLFRDYLRDGKDALLEERAQSENTGSAGGFIVPQGFYNKFLAALKQVDGIFAAATVLPTSENGTFPLPLDDDSANNAGIIAESGTSTPVDCVFDQLSFGKCPTWRSGQVRASMELVADSFFDLGGLLAGNFARRFARGIGAAHTATLLGAATLGLTAASATAVTADEVLSLVDSVDPAYGDNGIFLMRLSVWTSILKLKAQTGGNFMVDEYERDAQGRRTLFGFPVLVSPSMGALTTGQKTILFGDLSRFIRREVRGSLTVKTLIERYAEVGQVGYEAFWRVDGNLARAANSPVPVKYLQQL